MYQATFLRWFALLIYWIEFIDHLVYKNHPMKTGYYVFYILLFVISFVFEERKKKPKIPAKWEEPFIQPPQIK